MDSPLPSEELPPDTSGGYQLLSFVDPGASESGSNILLAQITLINKHPSQKVKIGINGFPNGWYNYLKFTIPQDD